MIKKIFKARKKIIYHSSVTHKVRFAHFLAGSLGLHWALHIACMSLHTELWTEITVHVCVCSSNVPQKVFVNNECENNVMFGRQVINSWITKTCKYLVVNFLAGLCCNMKGLQRKVVYRVSCYQNIRLTGAMTEYEICRCVKEHVTKLDIEILSRNFKFMAMK